MLFKIGEVLTGEEIALRGFDRLVMLTKAVAEFNDFYNFEPGKYKGFVIRGNQIWGMDTVMLHNHTKCVRLK